jgi:prophage regulatory protein
MTTEQNTTRRVMRLPDVEQATGFKVSHIYNLMKEGKFPKSRRIGCRAVGWDSTEIQQWIDDRLGATV